MTLASRAQTSVTSRLAMAPGVNYGSVTGSSVGAGGRSEPAEEHQEAGYFSSLIEA